MIKITIQGPQGVGKGQLAADIAALFDREKGYHKETHIVIYDEEANPKNIKIETDVAIVLVNS